MSHSNTDILISVDDRYVQSMLGGVKKVELRRRPVSVNAGDRVWIYSKVPAGEVKARGIVEQVFRATPADIWKHYGHVSGISQNEFEEYYAGVDEGCAIVFAAIDELETSISLETIRETVGKFHPPQFFKYLNNATPELALFNQAACLV
jgi:predicted transcriptional regulator